MEEKITEEIKIAPAKFENFKQEIKNIPDLQKKIEASFPGKTTEILEVVLGGAIYVEASDIHFEPGEEGIKLRVRIDGLLQDVLDFDLKIYKPVLSRLKLLSGLKLNITNKPQDGRFSIITGQPSIEEEQTIEVRASSLPTPYGESIVLRILNPKCLIEIRDLGLRKDLLGLFEKEIQRPNGMLIVTGPTGSGKTTTLYAFLKKIVRPEIKIITIEDPIEYHLKGISQTQTAPEKGYNFANGLRSIVRQDPDVILVGEIRDLETADIALQAALTGHLVLTTLHTNDAAGTIIRLTSLGAKVANIGPALNMAIAQRLVRKVCKNCSELKTPDLIELKKFKEGLKNIPEEIRDLNNKTAQEKREGEISPVRNGISNRVKIPKIKGCRDCNFTGYKGRIGIFEAFLIDAEMEKFILKNPFISALRSFAVKKGMITMYQDGLIKVLEGITTIEEVERVAGLPSYQYFLNEGAIDNIDKK